MPMDFSFIEDDEQRAKAEEAYKESVQKAVDTEVAGLKNKNAELIEEKRKASETLEEYKARTEGLDLEKAKEAMELLEKTKRKDLLEDGKLDEYIQAEVQTKQREIEAQFSSQLDVTQQELAATVETATRYEALYKNKIMEDNLREVALKSGCTPDAEVIRDIVGRGKQVFSLNADETGIEAKNADGSFKKTLDGDKILTPEAWVDDLKKTCPYYFPASHGTGASGGGAGKGGGGGADLKDRIQAALDAKDMNLFRELRKKQGASFR